MVVSYKIFLRLFKTNCHPSSMKNLKPIEKLLRNHTVSAEEFLSTPNISSAIRSQLSRFISYCKTHKPFTVRMLQLAFNISYEELQNQTIKKASYTANQVLGNQEPQIAQMFFQPPPKEEPEQSQIKEQISDGGITSQAERLFKFSDDQDQAPLPAEEQRQVQISRQELVALSFEILKNKEVNDTCLGHLQKMYSFFIRHEPIPVLAYFETHPQTLYLLLKNIQYSSISTLLAQLLTSQDKNKEYKYEQLKKSILEKAMEQIFSNVKDEFFFDGALVFLDEVLSATKQSYFEYFEDFKRISSILVTGQMMQRFYNELIDADEEKLFNISRYLENLFSRINSDNEENRYYQREQNQPTVNFQVNIFVQNLRKLMNLSTKIANYKSITKIHYYSFLQGLINCPQVKSITIPVDDNVFMNMLETYKECKTGGIVKNKLYQIIKELLSRTSQQKLKQIIQNKPQLFETYFSILKQANYANTKAYNKNQQSAFDVSLIAQLTRKKEQELAVASKAMGKDMKRICKKYDTKIASFQSSASFSLEEQCNFYQYNGDNNRTSSNESGTGFNLSIGKNNVSIPVLHLPDRYNTSQKQEKEPSPEIINSPNSPSNSPTLPSQSAVQGVSSGDAVIEEEEVIVLTDKLKDNKPLKLQQIMSDARDQVKDKKPEIPPQSQGKKEQNPIKIETKEKTKLMDVPRLQLTSKLIKEGKFGDDESKAKFFARHLALYA